MVESKFEALILQDEIAIASLIEIVSENERLKE